MVQVTVRDNNIDQALKILKKKMQREGILSQFKRQSHYEKPSEKANRREKAKIARWNKLRRKEEKREGQAKRPYWGKKSRARSHSPC